MKVGDLVRVIDSHETFMGMIGLVIAHIHEPELDDEWFFRILDLDDLGEEFDYYEQSLEVISESR